MAHLNLVMIHPFRDGNGRMARALATLVLTRSDIGEPEFCSIEEWLGANTEDYYSVLARTGRGSWQPRGDVNLWLAFNLRERFLQRLDDAGQLHLRRHRDPGEAEVVGPLVVGDLRDLRRRGRSGYPRPRPIHERGC